MSVLILGTAHIDALLALIDRGPSDMKAVEWRAHSALGSLIPWEFWPRPKAEPVELLTHVGKVFMRRNIEAYRQRYPGAEIVGNIAAVDAYTFDPDDVDISRVPTATEGLKLLDCLEYNSEPASGKDVYRTAKPQEAIDNLRRALTCGLPGYSAGRGWPWIDRVRREEAVGKGTSGGVATISVNGKDMPVDMRLLKQQAAAIGRLIDNQASGTTAEKESLEGAWQFLESILDTLPTE